VENGDHLHHLDLAFHWFRRHLASYFYFLRERTWKMNTIDKAKQSKARQAKASQDKPRQAKTSQDKPRRDETRQDIHTNGQSKREVQIEIDTDTTFSDANIFSADACMCSPRHLHN
jgi:hypothetical protein